MINENNSMRIKIKVGSLIINDKGEILLIKEKFKQNRFPLWNIITGTYGDSGNETIPEVAIRECQEEVSLKVKLIGAVGCHIIRENKKNIRIQFTFLAKNINGAPRLADKEKQAELNENIHGFKWFGKKEILQMNPDEFVAPRIYIILVDWVKKGKYYPLGIFKDITIN
ncbi:NUDIX hydrolase [Patescibacteria group bacterium]|nr:NUDIX hydrolase [Patescibacteria group bacterium]MBU4368469.1 NUDIX hydrolase [Patescibacteria group bacterium]